MDYFWKKNHKLIKFNHKTWLTPYFNMNIRKYQFCKKLMWMDNAVFGITMENMAKHWHIRLVTIEKRRNFSVTKPNYLPKKIFTEKLLAIEMKRKLKY